MDGLNEQGMRVRMRPTVPSPHTACLSVLVIAKGLGMRVRTSRCVRQGGAVLPVHRVPERVYHPGHAAVERACHMMQHLKGPCVRARAMSKNQEIHDLRPLGACAYQSDMQWMCMSWGNAHLQSSRHAP